MEPTKTKPRTTRKTPAKSRLTNKTPTTSQAQPKTLITGGTGFLGRHLLHQLIEAGEQHIRVLATKTPTWLAELNVEIVEGSITSPDLVKRAVEDVTQIYHLAGRVSRDPNDGHQMHALHVEGTRLLCEAAVKAGVRNIVLASSSGTIAVTEDGDRVPDETWPV
ncbi:MAG: NAD-dependent epimerase/dehydratase family protein, partial [Pyrinomonadaceae bacterium]|nr:NAD-dependent epimerase/dehydratase family protein [Pyrinomonadaceae bacterium]